MNNDTTSTVPSTPPGAEAPGGSIPDGTRYRSILEAHAPEDRLDPKKKQDHEVALVAALIHGGDEGQKRLANTQPGDFFYLIRRYELQALAELVADHVRRYGEMPEPWWLEKECELVLTTDSDFIPVMQAIKHKPTNFKPQFEEIDEHMKKRLYAPLFGKDMIEAYGSGDLARMNSILDQAVERRSSIGSDQKKFDPVLVAEFIADAQELRWIADGAIPRRATCVLCGMQKGGKSYFAQKLCRHVAMGENFGALKIAEKHGVLYLTWEDDESVFKHRLEGEDLGDNFYVQYRPPIDLFTGKGVPDLIAFMRKNSLRFLVIDPLARAHSAESENDASMMAVVMGRCDEIANEIDGTVFVIHHWNKSKDASGMERARGSSVIVTSPRAVMNWRGVDENTSAISINGNSTTVRSLTVRYVAGKVIVEDGAPMREETLAELDKMVESVNRLGLLKPEGSTADEIRKASGIQKSEHSVRNMLEDLSSDVHKRITMVVNGRKKLFQPRKGE